MGMKFMFAEASQRPPPQKKKKMQIQKALKEVKVKSEESVNQKKRQLSLESISVYISLSCFHLDEQLLYDVREYLTATGALLLNPEYNF